MHLCVCLVWSGAAFMAYGVQKFCKDRTATTTTTTNWTEKRTKSENICSTTTENIAFFEFFHCQATGFNKFISQQQKHTTQQNIYREHGIAVLLIYLIPSLLLLKKWDKAPAMRLEYGRFFPIFVLSVIWKHAFLLCLRTFFGAVVGDVVFFWEIEMKNIRLMFIQNVLFRIFRVVISPFAARLVEEHRRKWMDRIKKNVVYIWCLLIPHIAYTEANTPLYRTSHEINKWCTPRCVLCLCLFCIIPFYDEKFKLDRLRVWNTWTLKKMVFVSLSLTLSSTFTHTRVREFDGALHNLNLIPCRGL